MVVDLWRGYPDQVGRELHPRAIAIQAGSEADGGDKRSERHCDCQTADDLRFAARDKQQSEKSYDRQREHQVQQRHRTAPTSPRATTRITEPNRTHVA